MDWWFILPQSKAIESFEMEIKICHNAKDMQMEFRGLLTNNRLKNIFNTDEKEVWKVIKLGLGDSFLALQ